MGDSIEVCPGALSLTQEIISLLEVSRGNALIVDYGEDHAFSGSFRVNYTYILIYVRASKIIRWSKISIRF